MIFGCIPDWPDYEVEQLRVVRSYPKNIRIEFFYDLDSDKRIDVVEFRRWDPSTGYVSMPIEIVWCGDKDFVISEEEGLQRPDPMPYGSRFPPYRNRYMDSVL